MYGYDMEEPKLPAAVYRRSVSLFPCLNNQQILTSPTASAQRNTATNIFTYHTAGVWEREREGQCSTNYSLHPFGIFLRDSQLLGEPKTRHLSRGSQRRQQYHHRPILLLPSKNHGYNNGSYPVGTYDAHELPKVSIIVLCRS